LKDLQNRIQQMLADRKNHIRVISMITALSLLVMFIAPMLLVSPGISLTKNSYSPVKLGNTIVRDYDGTISINTQINNSIIADANEVNGITYSPASVSLKTLLFGDGTGTNWLTGEETLDQALAKAEDEYFLGLASDFCAFINEDFTAFEADAEGRMAVGGDLKFEGRWNYQIGSGDYASVTPLTETDEYQGEDNERYGFAHVLCGGKLYRVNTISTGNADYKKSSQEDWHVKTNGSVKTIVYDPEHDMYKKLFVDTVSGSKCWGPDGDQDGNQDYSNSFSSEWPGNDANCNHDYLRSVNQLAQIYNSDTIKVKDIIQKVYTDITKRSSLLSKIKGIAGHVEGSTVIFDGAGAEGNTVYFTLDQWGEDYNDSNINQVEFRNIPENANIVVNVGGKNFNIFGMNGDNRIVKTFINDIEISQTGGDIKTNNNKASGRILYNFYEATEGKIQCNFNGTVLSPLANVTTPPTSDNKCPGHLSGALIANSHWGYIEFGYRPYRGGSEIVGLTSGYVVPVDKIIEGTDNTPLPGARFTIQKTEDGVTSTVGGWVSGDSTKYAPLPFKVDFSGDTDYLAVKNYLAAQAESNDTQSKNISHFSKKALVDALGGGFKADDDAETTTVETEETTSADTATIETETTAAETTAAEETTAITSATEETTSSETETTEVAETTVSEVTEPVTEAEVQDETDIPDEETEVTDEELADVQNIQNFEILADDDQSETDPSETPATTTTTTPANVFQSQFIIRESNPPEGFFITNKRYTVDIIEKINDVIEKDGKYYPDNVDVDVTINGDNYNSHSKLNINDNRNALDMVENRVITIDGVQFTLTIADHKATSVAVGSIDVTPTEGKVFPYNNKRYYFDPEYMMVIPLPNENLKFENEPGLYFKKVDDNGNPVTGATITLDPPISGWEQGKLIKLSDIADTVYTFTETVAPPGYEKAEPIHFKRTGDYTIKYWTDHEEDNQTLDLRVPGNQIIKMVDQRILGAKLKIFKYRQTAENEPEVQLTGAKFSLYAEDDTLLKSNINADNEQINLMGIQDTTYVENGYLKPGIYYLKETKTPESDGDPYEYPGKLYFVVNNDFTVKAYTAPIALGIKKSENNYSISFTLTDNNVVKHIVSDEGQTDKITIENVTSINVKCDKTIEQAYVGAVAGEGFAKNPYDKDELNLSFNPPIEVNNLKVMANNLNVTYAEIQTSDGTRYVYPAPDPNSAITASDLLSKGETDNGVQTLRVKNEKQGEYKDVTVTKKWKNDEGFEGLRSDVTVKLYCSTEELEESKIAEELAKTENSKLTPYTPDVSDGTAILNSANNWTYKWEDLPAYSDGNNGKVFYYYYVKETSAHSGYTTTYQAEGNDLTVINTLNTINIKAEKQWVYQNGTIELPPSITFMLQMRDNSNSEWVDVPGKKITLTADDSWMGEFKNLPEGKQYRMKEVDVPTGWIPEESSNETNQNNATLSITNTADLSSLKLNKAWDEDGSGSVDSVKVELYRKEQSLWPENQSAEDVMEDYARLLQYSLYFYDGVMCGDQVDETSNYTWRSDCHTEDEVKGGFHDAGDHVMFGLPAGFSASTLGWSLKEYRAEFDSLGQTPHIKMIIDHYAEFFNNAVRYNADGTVKEILVQKGHGNTDHAYWGMPEGQPSREDQMYWKSDTGSDVAAEYAAALALAYINFHDTDETKYRGYLETAKKLYEYSRRVDKALNEENINIDETDKNQYPGYYKSNQYADDQAWAASWIAVADSEAEYNGTSYKVEAQSRLTSDDINGWDWGGYHWNNVRHGAEFVLAAYLGESWDNVKNFVNSKGSDWKGDRYKYPDEWGASRYNSGFQTVALAAVHQAETKSNVDISRAEIADWCKSQMNYILGDNKYNMCFVTAFSDHSPLKVHFRAGSGAVYNMQTKDDPNIIDKAYTNDVNRLIGGMVGGSAGDSDNYEDRRTFYQRNEVASDYNAVLVGAAAGLYSYFRTGATYEIPGVKNQYLPAASTSQEGQTEGTANAVNPAASMANAGKAVATTVRKLYKTGVDTNIAASTGTKTRALRLGKAEKLAGSLDSIAGVIGPRLMAAADEANNTIIVDLSENIPQVSDDGQKKMHEYHLNNVDISGVKMIVCNFDKKPSGDGGQASVDWSWYGFSQENFESDTSYIVYKNDNGVNLNGSLTIKVKLDPDCDAKINSVEFRTESSNHGSEGGEQQENQNYIVINSNDIQSPEDYPDSDPNMHWLEYNVTGLNYSGVKKIVCEFNKDYGYSEGHGSQFALNGNYGDWLSQNNAKTLTLWESNEPIDLTQFSFKTKIFNSSQIRVDKFLIYLDENTISLSADKTEALTGEAVTLTPIGNIEDLTYTITKNGDVYNNNVINNNVFTPTEHGTYEITAANSADNTSTVTITVKDFALVSHDVNVKAGNTVNIPITYNGENNFTFDPAESEYFDIRVDDNNVVVTGKQATADPIEVRISRNGYSETISVNVNNGISINGDKNEIAINEAIQLEAENAVGSVNWESSDPAIATVDNGKVIGKGFGTVTITATDDDGEATYQIRVEPIPKDAEFVDTITIEKSPNWTAEVNNLPKVSPNGIPYVYYIKEEVSNQYIPLSYTGNGTKLDGNNVPTITVTNKLTKNLPITGGRGTEKIYMAGGVMMLLAAAAYAMFKRREFGKEE